MDQPRERWLVAAWPGMGQVATTAAIYMLSKLKMHQVGEFTARELFELETVEVNSGLLHAAKLPRSRLFLWMNPLGNRDIVVFLGEAQPPTGKLALCERLLSQARTLGVNRFFTFSAMATDMPPNHPSRTFGVASDPASLADLSRHHVSVLAEGTIAGLNGVALAAAAEAGLPATGLLGEMPGLAAQIPYPSAAAAVLKVFRELAGVPLDLSELEEYGRSMQVQLSQVYEKVREVLGEEETAEESQSESAESKSVEPAAPEHPVLADEDAERIERLFRDARSDRSKAFELKRELDRLGAFRRFEDRFLDLFEPPGR